MALRAVKRALVPLAVARQVLAPVSFAYSSSKRATVLPLPRYHLPPRRVSRTARSSVWSKTGQEGKGSGWVLAPPRRAGFSDEASAARAAPAIGAAARKLRRVGGMDVCSHINLLQMKRWSVFAGFLLGCAGALSGAGLKAGVGRADITPAGPIWLSGYAARTHPSTGAQTRLWAKALAIESGPRQRIVIVSTDVVW